MKAERPLKVVFFKTDNGSEPVRDWLKKLSKEDCKIIGTDILSVQHAWPIGKPLVDHLVMGSGKSDPGWTIASHELCSP